MIRNSVLVRVLGLLAVCGAVAGLPLHAFKPDLSEQPATHPPLTPADGEMVALNPPPMIWRVDDRAASYTVEFSQDARFRGKTIRVPGIDLPFYNHSEELREGTWFWRYYVVAKDGEVSEPSPGKSFVVTKESTPFAVPAMKDLLATMPGHPRIFTTPDELAEFRARRDGPAREAWLEVKRRADRLVRERPEMPKLVPIAEAKIKGPTPDSNSWKEGQPVRRQVFFLQNGEAFYAPSFGYRALTASASKVETLSYAYLISGDKKYADAAREWANFVAQARLDYHIPDAGRAAHDTAVYAYEQGLKGMAVAFDRIQEILSEAEKKAIIEHVEFHGTAAYVWLRERAKIHLNYQQSHPQQALHPLLTTSLALATDSEKADEWVDYLVRQYANRIAWTADDGGYFEGQTYGHKFQWILEALVSMKTATGIDVFKNPRIRNSGEFWLYCMSLNYWYQHGGDIYSLIWSYGNPADGYISNLMASMNGDRYVKWWSDTVNTNPVHIPLQYVSQSGVKPKPPVDIAQARLFPQTGQLSAFDRFYDHGRSRIFFRSSPWGSHSHSHADQNGFVIHDNGEILAADVGYYTYYGDEYHSQWSYTSNTHNTILVNGEGQPKSIESKGEITEFFDVPKYSYFVGDASRAYKEPLERYKRSILFVRPDVWVIYDELRAKEPTEFSWLLNTFDKPEIDETGQSMVVPQQSTRLRVDHLLPKDLRYESSNERRFPILTRAWSRVSEAFPEPWHSRATTSKKESESILSFLHSYIEPDGARVRERWSTEDEKAVAVAFSIEEGGREIVLFRRNSDSVGTISAGRLSTDGRVATIGFSGNGRVARAMGSGLTRLTFGGRDYVKTAGIADVYVDYENSAAAAQIVVKSAAPGAVEVALDRNPAAVFVAPPHAPREARVIPFSWRNGILSVKAPEMAEWVLWVDPAVDPRQPLPELELAIRDSAGAQRVKLEMAVADNGDWIGFADLMPREAGRYALTSSVEGAELLLQDRWDPSLSRRGKTEIEGSVRDATEIFVRFPPGKLPELTLDLRESHTDRIVNFLRNGNFEEGIPNYPPRGWTLGRVSADPDLGWAGWTQEDAFEGKSAMKFVRPTGTFSANSHPMRLRTGGRYVFRFMARGDATHATASVSSSRGRVGSMKIEPSEDWREYRVEVDLEPGFTQVQISFAKGGEKDQTVWIDDMEFGLAPNQQAVSN